MRHDLPGQIDLPQTGPDVRSLTQAKASAPMKPAKPQAPCDIGLFSDDADQMDLIEMFMD